MPLGAPLLGSLPAAAKGGAPALTFWQARLLIASVLPLKQLTPQEALRQIRFIQDSGIVTAMVGLLSAVRGTALYQRLQKENRLLADASGDNTDCSINFMPKKRYAALIDGYKRIVRTIYSPDHFYARVKKFLEEYKPPHIGLSKLQLQHVKAFIMSIVVLGIKGKERLHYWRLFLWCVVSRPRLTPLAVTFAIYGFHFRKVFERIE